MGRSFPHIHLVRHGETPWSLTGKHTGRSDIALTERGERDARLLGERLRGIDLGRVFTSPLVRAHRTCELAGCAASASVDPDLMEWDYGAFEGRTGEDIRSERPDWLLFRDGAPGGESPAQVAARADRVVARLRAVAGNATVFAHGHLLRMLAARWLGLAPSEPRLFLLSTASLSILGYEHGLHEPVVRLWNDDAHLRDAGARPGHRPV